MDPRLKQSLLWGLIGGLAFLVLLQGYELLTSQLVDWAVKLGVAAAVVLGATALTYVVARRRTSAKEQT